MNKECVDRRCDRDRKRHHPTRNGQRHDFLSSTSTVANSKRPLKTAGVGEAIWHAVSRLTGIHLSGRIGCPQVRSRGSRVVRICTRRRNSVEVVEPDPFRRLIAHYDGYPTPTVLGRSTVQVIVTATSVPSALPAKHIAGRETGDPAQCGPWRRRVQGGGDRAPREAQDNVAPGVVNYAMPKGKQITVLGAGHPLNIVLNSGSPEPVLLHYALLGLTLEWLLTQYNDLEPGEHLVEERLEQEAASLALDALNGFSSGS